MSNLRILIIAVILFSLLGTGFISGESLKRNIKLHIEVNSQGMAKMNRKLEVEESDLANLYCEHAKVVKKDKKVKKQFLDEVAKGHGLIFGKKPKLKIKNQKISSSLSREVEGDFDLLACSSQKGQKGVKEIRIRKFKNKKSVVHYLEYVLNSRLFESAFLRSVKGEQTLVSREETVWQLPAGAKIINGEELEGQNWRVDFGGESSMQANLEVDEENRMITLVEQIVVSENAPEHLLAKDNAFLIGNLREYGSFVIQYETGDSSSQGEPVPEPAPSVEALDLASSWSWGLNVDKTFFYVFTYHPSQQVTVKVTPSIKLSFDLGATIKWAWRWYWSGWRLRCTLDYFETTLRLKPAVGANISISGNAAVDAVWDETVGKKSRSFTFWVGCLPVLIVLEADLSLNASCNLEGTIEIVTGGGVTLDTGITCRYKNGWDANSHFYLTRHFDKFEASAGIEAKARAEVPFTVSAYIYYVAGPFAQLNPYIEASSKAEVTTTGQTGTHYNLHGGFEVNGGAKVAGWLEGLLGNLGQYTRTFYTKDVTIYEGYL
ncbi:MAG: hypothetical protein GTO45_13435 [Candidatus Aminicenantes bacterium]|nr:hypothetical protein [Candidatus Aminicenantes bacterium]NIM79781.1 hypothetical protein [Candidatus Aminicenantes bacterium]NIN19109.1 hypothetical protein [Candidatus Aminicenantes bacterium]NIN43011.1 hypothetical protein [Candidatus Aminicenantes bacterium]NIN85754.1 hypothetical protein [Candidatus Aminicenantes bacterium]